jgi:prepilin-type N-terminal cleavage/methylation domain-containing protein
MKRKLAGSRAVVRLAKRAIGGESAFTLIELLVVFAIIGVLAALMLPALNRAKDAAQLSTCRNNLRQLMLATAQYVQEFNVYPSATNFVAGLYPFTRTLWPENNWDIPASKYLGSRAGLYACPGYNALKAEFLSGTSRSAPAVGSYGYNCYGGADYVNSGIGGLGGGILGGGRWGRQIPDEQVVAPADMIGFGDSVISTSPHDLIAWGNTAFDATALLTVESPNYNGAVYGTPSGNRGAQVMKQRHAAKWNVGFCDTHVETLRPAYLFAFSDDISARRWNRDHQPHNATWIPPK